LNLPYWRFVQFLDLIEVLQAEESLRQITCYSIPMSGDKSKAKAILDNLTAVIHQWEREEEAEMEEGAIEKLKTIFKQK